MQRFYDADKLQDDVRRAIQDTLQQHGVTSYSLLGVTTVLEAISSELKFQLNSALSKQFAELGCAAYNASLIPRRVALLQSPHSMVVNSVMECIVAALLRSKRSLTTSTLRRRTYRIFLNQPAISIKAAEQQESSLAPAFSSACGYLEAGGIIQQTEPQRWHLCA